MSVSIQIDVASLAHLNRQLAVLQQAGPRSLYSAMMKIGYRIVNTAHQRLKGQKHVVTGRLYSSMFVKTNTKPHQAYSDDNGKPYISELPSVAVENMEIAVGTNVDYASKIENKYPYLSWAIHNIDISKTWAEEAKKDLANALRFGIGVLPQNRP